MGCEQIKLQTDLSEYPRIRCGRDRVFRNTLLFGYKVI